MNSLLIDVRDADIDQFGHVNNSVYLRWIEQVVHDHWRQIAPPEEFSALRWVAVRHEIDYRRPAFAGDRLQALTRLSSVKRARAWYRTSILRDDVTLAEALSCWCCIDAATQSLTVVPPFLVAQHLGD